MPVDNPPVGATVVHDQPMGAVPGDPGQGAVGRKHNLVVTIDSRSRQVLGSMLLASEQSVPSAESRPVPPGAHMVFWGTDSRHVPVSGGQYLPYPPLVGMEIPSVPDPVNPWGIGPKWLDILSRFAHDVMTFNPQSNHLRDAGTHATGHQPPTSPAFQLKNKATYQLGRAAVGVAYNRIGEWMKLDAQRLAQYPASVPDSDNWKIWLEGAIPAAEDEIPIPNMGEMMETFCGDEVKEVVGLCVGAWVYLLNERIDASSYDSNMNSSGEIRLPDPVWDVWRPSRFLHRVTGTRSERADEWAEIMGWFTEAHDHYLTSVAPSIEHSSA